MERCAPLDKITASPIIPPDMVALLHFRDPLFECTFPATFCFLESRSGSLFLSIFMVALSLPRCGNGEDNVEIAWPD